MGIAAVIVAIPSMATDLSAPAIKVSWIPTIYILSSVAFMLPVGKLADMFGRKKLYMLGLGLNALSATLCGLATDIDVILFYRFVQGIAGAMIFGTGIAIVTSVVPESKRGTALGIVAAFVYVGLTLAPAVGGYLTQWFNWQMVFFFQVPLILVLMLFIAVFIKGEWKQSTPTKFDYKGTLLFMGFTALLVYGLSHLDSFDGIVSTIASFVCLLIFIVHQSKSRQPLIRVQLFKESRVFSLSLTTSFFMYASNFAILFLMSLYLQYVQNFTPAQAGNLLLLQAFAMAIIAPFAGRLSDSFQPRIVASAGCILVAVGLVLLNQLHMTSSMLQIGAALFLMGVGFGLFSTPNNNAIMSAVHENEVGVASASMNLSRTVGNLFGMSMVNLMVNYYIGDVQISNQVQDQLLSTVLMALKMSLMFVCIAIITSLMRGKQ